jgi:hypothetical protein
MAARLDDAVRGPVQADTAGEFVVLLASSTCLGGHRGSEGGGLGHRIGRLRSGWLAEGCRGMCTHLQMAFVSLSFAVGGVYDLCHLGSHNNKYVLLSSTKNELFYSTAADPQIPAVLVDVQHQS